MLKQERQAYILPQCHRQNRTLLTRRGAEIYISAEVDSRTDKTKTPTIADCLTHDVKVARMPIDDAEAGTELQLLKTTYGCRRRGQLTPVTSQNNP